MAHPTPELINYWRPVLEQIDPLRPLRSDNVEELYTERLDPPYRAITTRLLRCSPAQGQTIVLYGARGAGKSSELTRIADVLRDSFAVIQVDLGAGLPDDTSTLALVLLLGVAALAEQSRWREVTDDATSTTAGLDRLTRALKGFSLGGEFVAGLLEKIGPLIAITGVDGGASAAIGASLSTASALAQTAALKRELSRGPLAGRLPPDRFEDARAVVEAVNGILSDLEKLAGRPPLLLADGLDKRTSIDDVQKALADVDLLTAVSAPMVLTGPVVLRHDPRFRAIGDRSLLITLPNITVRRRVTPPSSAVEDNPEGIKLLRDLFARRMRSLDISTDEVVDADALTLAARMSSGIIREFLTILTNAGDVAIDANERKIRRPHVEAAVRRLRLSLQGSLDANAWVILARLLEKPGTLPADRGADVLLYENIIACYTNGHVWYRPHEAIVDSVRENSQSDESLTE
jgi:hypothetical protein